jgi:hypothetical protein
MPTKDVMEVLQRCSYSWGQRQKKVQITFPHLLLAPRITAIVVSGAVGKGGLRGLQVDSEFLAEESKIISIQVMLL